MAIEQHYTGQELAELLGLDYETILSLARSGEIASIRVGRLRRFPESAVNAYLSKQSNVIELRPRTVVSPDSRRR